MGTHITDYRRNRLLPKEEFLYKFFTCGQSHHYNLPGQTVYSPELVFDNFPTPRHVTVGEQFKVWFIEDLLDCSEEDNIVEKACVHAYALYV